MQILSPAEAVSAPSAPSTKMDSLPRGVGLLLTLALFAATLFLYLPVRNAGFINYDDNFYVTQNFHVWAGLTWKNVVWAFTTLDVANWHPLAWLSHMLDVQFFGLDPAGHHQTSVILHALNVALLFWALQLGTRRAGASFLTAALFAVHPLAVESVAWVAERKNILCTTFWLLAVLAYGAYAKQPSWLRYVLVAVIFALALMSKPMAVTLPFVLLLLDFWPLGRYGEGTGRNSFTWARGRQLVFEKLPLFVLSAASSWITLAAQRFEGAMNPASFPLRLRLGNAVLSYARYLGKIFWPAKFSIVYPHPRSSIHWWQVALASALLAAITFAVWRARRRPYLAVGWFYFLGTLVPVIGLVQVGSQGMADRYVYIPMMGILLMAVWLAAEAAERLRLARAGRIAFAASVLLVLAMLTVKLEGYWQNDIALFSHAVEVTAQNNVAHDLAGLALAQAGRLQEAAPHFYVALQINPRDEMAHANFGYYRMAQGDAAGATEQFKLAIANTGNRRLAAQMYADLGAVAWKQGKLEDSANCYLQSLRLIPDQYRANLNLALLLYDQGRVGEALRYIHQSLAIYPTSAAYLALGRALHAGKRDADAAAAYRQALKLTPNFPLAESELQALTGAGGRR